MATTIKAERTSIDIAGTPIDGLMLSTGELRGNKSQAAEAIGENRMSVTRFLKSHVTESECQTPVTLTLQGKTHVTKVRIEGYSKLVDALTLDLMSAYWLSKAIAGNVQAQALCYALATETLERRFNRAFGVAATEEEYDEKLKLRRGRLLARHAWGDAVKRHMEFHGYYGDKSRVRAEFCELTVRVNLKFYGVRHFKCDRDNMDDEQQELIKEFERAVVRHSKRNPSLAPSDLIDAALAIF